MPIPSFNHNLVLPPHLGDATKSEELSPYPCTTLELCQHFGTTPKRREILKKFLEFRQRLHTEGLINGFQWLDGSFLQDIENAENRSPNDLDLVTVYWNYDLIFQSQLIANFPEIADPDLAKKNYLLDHYPFDAGFSSELTIEYTRYWILLFSHTRLGVWKGMLRVELNTPSDDANAKLTL